MALVDRFDHAAFDLPGARAVIRAAVTGGEEWDVIVEPGRVRLSEPGRGQPDALLSADAATWEEIASDVARGMDAFRRGRLRVRRNLHLGVGFLAATSGMAGPGRLRFRRVRTRAGAFSIIEAGEGPPVLMLHGLGGTKASFLPSIAALAPSFRTVAVDLLGFGDSDKPLGASYGPEFQARAVEQLLDALELERAHIVGHSMGGRVALELGFAHADRSDGLVLMTPAMAWLRERRWAPYLRWIRPELGLIQVAPRAAVEPFMRWLIPGADTSWGQSAIDEFVRTYTSAAGPGRLLRGGAQHLPRRAARRRRASGRGCARWRRSRSSSGVATTGSCRWPSSSTSSGRCRRPSTSSSTAATCRRSSARARPTPRSRGSWAVSGRGARSDTCKNPCKVIGSGLHAGIEPAW